MKIPYIKIYTADLLAKTRRLNAEQIGKAVIGICEQGFENQTQYVPESAQELDFYNMLLAWKNESILAFKQKRNAGKKGGKKTQEKKKLLDGSTACFSASSTLNKQTETDTETDTETELEKEKDKKEKVTDTDTEIETETEKVKIKRFTKPTLAEISAYCAERKNTINPQTFFDFYEAKGWKIGTSPMKDWRAAVRTWESKQKENRNAGVDYNKQDADFSKYAGLGRVFGK